MVYDGLNIPLFTGFYTSQVVVWDFWTIQRVCHDIMQFPKVGNSSWDSSLSPWSRHNETGDLAATLQETNISIISHLGKRKIIFESALGKGYVSFVEGISFGEDLEEMIT